MKDRPFRSPKFLPYDIHHMLVGQGIETPVLTSKMRPSKKKEIIATSMHKILECLGLEMKDDSLQGTPERIAKMFVDEVFYGLDYANFPKCTSVQNRMQYDEMIAVKCQVRSLCEHHFVPFIGTAYVGYIPKNKVLGLSKFNRIVDFFSRRPQIQERLTEQVSATLRYILNTEDVAVLIEAEHFCVKLRGVQDETSTTVTSKLSGVFRTKPEARSEFLALARRT